jgi:hypothetical protein
MAFIDYVIDFAAESIEGGDGFPLETGQEQETVIEA